MFGLMKKRRRARLRAQPVPAHWDDVISRHVPYYRRLPPQQRRELQGLMQVFLAEKNFEGCGGLELTEEVRLAIAAQACVLLLGRETDIYPRLQSILVYPEAFVTGELIEEEDGLVTEDMGERPGESWGHGTVILSWQDAVEGAADPLDGWNVVYHEFAHQLDEESGESDGVPPLADREQLADWLRVLGREYEALLQRTRRGRPGLLDEYGAENPAEFFAVATEFFFEQPHALRRRHPELYSQLRRYYCQDPAALWEDGQR